MPIEIDWRSCRRDVLYCTVLCSTVLYTVLSTVNVQYSMDGRFDP